jgi:glycosyltransferase involved in cell wall biosynthesis
MSMKILMLHGSHTEGGGDTVYINQLVSLLPGYDIDPFLISIQQEKSNFSLQISGRGEKKTLTLDNISSINKFIEKFCIETKIDLIHIHTLYLTSVTKFCLTLRPVVKSPHSTDIVCPGTNKFWSVSEEKCQIPFGMHCFRHAYTKKCCSRSPRKLLSLYTNVYSETRSFSLKYKAIVVMSDFVRDECVLAGIPAEKIRVIPYFTMPVAETAKASEGRRLLYVGRLSQIKGVHTMIEALKPLFAMYPDLYLDIIGDGPYKNKIMDLADEYKLSHRIIFHGWQGRQEIKDALDNCYMLLFPSIYPEAFGISGIEAMMHGKPVVGFDVGGVHMWLKNGENGFMLPVKDIYGFRDKVEYLLNNPTVKNDLGLQAKIVTLQNFNPQEHITKLISVYHN